LITVRLLTFSQSCENIVSIDVLQKLRPVVIAQYDQG